MQKDLLEVSRSANIDLIPSQLTVSDKRFNPPEHNAQFNAKANQAQGNNKKRRERRRPTGNNSDKDKKAETTKYCTWRTAKKKKKRKKKRYIAQLMQRKASPSKKIRKGKKDKENRGVVIL